MAGRLAGCIWSRLTAQVKQFFCGVHEIMAQTQRGGKTGVRRRSTKRYKCDGDRNRKVNANALSPESRGMCPRSQPLNTIAEGKDGKEWIVMINQKGEHFWERRRYLKHTTDARDLFADPDPTMRLWGGGEV